MAAQDDLQGILLLGLDSRTTALTGIDMRAISLVGIDRRTGNLPTGLVDDTVPTVTEIYIDENSNTYVDEDASVYLANDT